MGERYNIHSQLEHLQSKYIGTGHADTTKYEWLTNQVNKKLLPLASHRAAKSIYFLSLEPLRGKEMGPKPLSGF